MDLRRPHGAVYMDELIHLKRDQTTSDSLFSGLLAQDAGELDLWVHDRIVGRRADLGRRL